MSAPRILRTLCLLLVLVSAMPLAATATASAGKRHQPRPPSLLWQTFPLRQRAPHPLGATSQAPAIAGHATAGRSLPARHAGKTLPARHAGKTFPSFGIIGLLAATMLAAAVLFMVRRPQSLAVRARTGPTGAERVASRKDRSGGRSLRRIPLRQGEIVEVKRAAAGEPVAEAHQSDGGGAGARTPGAIVAAYERALTATEDTDVATPGTEQDDDAVNLETLTREGRTASGTEAPSSRDARSETEDEQSDQPHPALVQPEEPQSLEAELHSAIETKRRTPKPAPERVHEHELIGDEERAPVSNTATPSRAFRPEPQSEPLSEAPRANVQPSGGTSKPEWKAAPVRPRARRAGAESCEITLWSGYTKKQFYAAPLGRAKAQEALALSSYFRSRDEDVPTATSERALQALVDQLENAGWEVVAKGKHWYQYRLERAASA
jgi:hypothetical protein